MLPYMLDYNSQLPQVHWLRVQFLQTTTNFVPNMFDWVHIRTIGGPIHAEWCLVHGGNHPLHEPDGIWHYHQPVANCCDTMPCHVEPSVPPELGDNKCSSDIWSRTHKEVFHIWEIRPIHVQNRLREPHYHHSWLNGTELNWTELKFILNLIYIGIWIHTYHIHLICS